MVFNFEFDLKPKTEASEESLTPKETEQIMQIWKKFCDNEQEEDYEEEDEEVEEEMENVEGKLCDIQEEGEEIEEMEIS